MRTARTLAAVTLLAAAGAGCKGIDNSFIHASADTINGSLIAGAGLYVATAVVNAFPESRGVTVASHPSGARVLIDGVDSGFSTPCCLALDDRKQRIDLVLEGYQPTSRVVADDNRTYLVYWDEGYLGPHTYRFPMFLNFYDGWVPVRFVETYSPERIFVRLRPTAVP